MNILYTCDNNYIWLMGISLISLFENNSTIKELNIFLLGDKISDDNKDILKNIVYKYKRKMEIIDVPNFEIPQELVSGRWPISAFIRLYSGQLLPENIHEVLYIDCDTIVTGNISELENYDFNNYVFYGVKDCISKKYKKNIGIKSNEKYINAGVLLINLDKLRQININETIDKYIYKYKNSINYADQDVLNGAFHDKINVLNPSYNIMTIYSVYTYEEIKLLRNPDDFYDKIEFENSIKTPIIIHYTTNMTTIRPWFENSNHPLVEEFRKYLKMSPWKEKKLKSYKFTSKEYKIIKSIQILPRGIAYRILGYIHSTLRPFIINLKAKLYK